jgi:hypothetical protein
MHPPKLNHPVHGNETEVATPEARAGQVSFPSAGK